MISPIAKRGDHLLRAAAEPEKAPVMKAYMKEIQDFLGVTAVRRKAVFSELKSEFGKPPSEIWEETIRELWNGPFREHRYLALNFTESTKKYISPNHLDLFIEMAEQCDWWDTTDGLGTHVFNPLYARFKIVEPVILDFRTSSNLWQRRISLLVHLNRKERTNLELLEETILMLAHEKEFFIRKAIGWVLRHLGKTNPDWVFTFVQQNKKVLSPLSIREAVKYLPDSALTGF